jgi:hypothetical protein
MCSKDWYPLVLQTAVPHRCLSYTHTHTHTSIVDEEKAKEAVGILLWAPHLNVWEAMILEDFTKDEANTKSMQQKVA